MWGGKNSIRRDRRLRSDARAARPPPPHADPPLPSPPRTGPGEPAPSSPTQIALRSRHPPRLSSGGAPGQFERARGWSFSQWPLSFVVVGDVELVAVGDRASEPTPHAALRFMPAVTRSIRIACSNSATPSSIWTIIRPAAVPMSRGPELRRSVGEGSEVDAGFVRREPGRPGSKGLGLLVRLASRARPGSRRRCAPRIAVCTQSADHGGVDREHLQGRHRAGKRDLDRRRWGDVIIGVDAN